ncbi:MAG: hypothetical protein EXR50_05175 [Dehalococcoidia bacterium]|nr:hypothetical protein [Dehalococcoidia bacterium]
MLEVILFLGFIALVSVLVLYPLFRPSAKTYPQFHVNSNGHLEEVEEERDLAISSLRELELEYQMGKLSDEDYTELREEYRRRAIALLKATDVGEESIDSAIEAEIRRLRHGVAGNGIAPARSATVCSFCGQAAQDTDKFCSNCGRTRGVIATESTGPPTKLRAAEPVDRSPRPALSIRARTWLAGGALFAVLFLAGVGALYFTSRGSQRDQQPIGQVIAASYNVISVSTANPRTLFMGSHDGMRLSIDGGRSWSPVPDVQSEIRAVLPDTPRDGAILAAGNGVFIKRDAPNSPWASVSNNLPGNNIRAMGRHPGNHSILYAFVAGRGIFGSEDGGSNWKPLSDQPLNADVTGITVVPGAADLIFISTAGAGVMGSANGGRTWEGANGFVNGALPTTVLMSITADPSSGDVFSGGGGGSFRGALYVGGPSGIFKSTDGGGSWLKLPLNSDAAAITVGPPGSQQLYVVNTQGQIFYSRNGGVTWSGKE